MGSAARAAPPVACPTEPVAAVGGGRVFFALTQDAPASYIALSVPVLEGAVAQLGER